MKSKLANTVISSTSHDSSTTPPLPHIATHPSPIAPRIATPNAPPAPVSPVSAIDSTIVDSGSRNFILPAVRPAPPLTSPPSRSMSALQPASPRRRRPHADSTWICLSVMPTSCQGSSIPLLALADCATRTALCCSPSTPSKCLTLRAKP